MRRWVRRVLRRCGIDVRFPDVVCPHHIKTIRMTDEGRLEVIDRRSLVFLDLPEAGELRDFVPVTGDAETASYISPDAIEVERRSTQEGMLVSWIPRAPLVRYALYSHQYGWMSAGASGAALFTEYSCEMKTGVVELGLMAPERFEAAVVFKRPRWRRLSSERSLVKYALGRRDAEGEGPAIVEDGARLQWKLVGPKIGERYVCVAFQTNGVEQWRNRLATKSLMSRMRRFLRPVASA